MTTAEALEALTDSGRFEQLAAAIVGLRNSEYACLISTGINARGRTVPSPVDGFNRISGSDPPHFVMLACTTTDQPHLRSKLLGKDGDLSKALRYAEPLRKRFPNARFTVILATSHSINAELLRDLHLRGMELGVSCDPWGNSRLARDLDTHPSGQWLRREYLGIEAQQLSRELLWDISSVNCESYEDDTSSLLGRQWVSRSADDMLEQLVASREINLIFLIGKPGLGKSVAACRCLRKTITNGGTGLWLPAEILLDSPSIEHSVGAQLQRQSPALSADQASRAFQVLEPYERLLLVIDDVNRLSDPQASLRKLLGWIRESESNSEAGQLIRRPVVAICPMWPRVWRGIASLIEKRRDVAKVHVGLMEMSEAIDVLRTGTKADEPEIGLANAVRIVRGCNRDPFLLGMWNRMRADTPSASPSFQQDVIEEFIQIKTFELEERQHTRLLAGEYRGALVDLARHMIRVGSFCVPMEDIKTWFSDQQDALDGIRELVRQAVIVEQRDDALVRFRHDRLLKHFATKALQGLLKVSPEEKVLNDPWFGEWIAEACLAERPSTDELRRIMAPNPCCVIELLRKLEDPLDSFGEYVLQFVLEDLSRGENSLFSRGTLYSDLCSALVDAPQSTVTQLRKQLPSSPTLLLAGLRNGFAEDGIAYCASRRGWYPAFSNGLLEYCLSDIRGTAVQDTLVEGVSATMTSGRLAQDGLIGALSLIGALADARLAETITQCWNMANDKEDTLFYALWAALRCGADNNEAVMQPLLATWVSLSDERPEAYRLSDRDEVGDALRLALTFRASSGIVKYLVNVARETPGLRWPIQIAVSDINDPDAVEFNLATLAEGDFMFDSIKWSPRLGRRSLSEASRDRLRAIWGDASRCEKLRRSAFIWWAQAATRHEAALLQAVPEEHVLAPLAIRERAILGDRSVVPQLRSLLGKDAWNFNVASAVWTAEFADIADKHLRELATGNHDPFTLGYTLGEQGLVECLARVPVETSNSLLERNWAHLSQRPKFVELALYVGLPRLLEQARGAFNKCPAGLHAVRHIELHLGWQRSKHDAPAHVILDRVERLLPHVRDLDEHDVHTLADQCMALGQTSVLPKLQPYLSDDMRPRMLPTDDDLLKEVDELASSPKGIWHVQFTVEDSAKRGDDPARLPRLIAEWLPRRSDAEALAVGSEFLALMGRREDIAILDRWAGDTSSADFARVRSDALTRIQRRTLI